MMKCLFGVCTVELPHYKVFFDVNSQGAHLRPMAIRS